MKHLHRVALLTQSVIILYLVWSREVVHDAPREVVHDAPRDVVHDVTKPHKDVTICLNTMKRANYIHETLATFSYQRVVVVETQQNHTYVAQLRRTYPQHTVKPVDTLSTIDDPCQLSHLYGDDAQRVAWRSQRVLDMVKALRMCQGAHYLMMVEDDTPMLGDVQGSIERCQEILRNDQKVICRWPFYMKRADAQRRVGRFKAPERLTYVPANLQGVFGLMMPTTAWLELADWAELHYDKAPADWMIGRWLFRNNWRMVFLDHRAVLYHAPGLNKRQSTLQHVQKRVQCGNEPQKWYRVHWVGGEKYFLEVPFFDIVGNDLGVAEHANQMDTAAHMIVCEKTPSCRAVNHNGWMKHTIRTSDVSRVPSRKVGIFVVLDEEAKKIYDWCNAKTPRSLLKKWY